MFLPGRLASCNYSVLIYSLSQLSYSIYGSSCLRVQGLCPDGFSHSASGIHGMDISYDILEIVVCYRLMLWFLVPDY